MVDERNNLITLSYLQQRVGNQAYGEADIHPLNKLMGNSVAMIECHYSKWTATMAAARLA